MEITQFVLGLIVAVVAFKVVKHLLFRKTYKVLMAAILLLIIFLYFCYILNDYSKFKDNKIIYTGSAVAEEVMNIFKEETGVVQIDQLVNSTLKTNKLFKSQKSL